MITALAWENAKCFSKCLEQMDMFRQSYGTKQDVIPDLLGSMPTPYVIHGGRKIGGVRCADNTASWFALVPMWRLAPTKFSQN